MEGGGEERERERENPLLSRDKEIERGWERYIHTHTHR